MMVIAQHLGLDKDKLSPDSDLIDDLNLQTLELADIAAILSEKFGADIDPQESIQWRSVLDVIRSVTEGGVSGTSEGGETKDDTAL